MEKNLVPGRRIDGVGPTSPPEGLRVDPEETPAEPGRFGEQDENGVDLSTIRENLKLTPTERLIKHQRALELLLEVKRAAEAAGLRPPDTSTE